MALPAEIERLKLKSAEYRRLAATVRGDRASEWLQIANAYEELAIRLESIARSACPPGFPADAKAMDEPMSS